jgi:hypothetical protein
LTAHPSMPIPREDVAGSDLSTSVLLAYSSFAVESDRQKSRPRRIPASSVPLDERAEVHRAEEHRVHRTRSYRKAHRVSTLATRSDFAYTVVVDLVEVLQDERFGWGLATTRAEGVVGVHLHPVLVSLNSDTASSLRQLNVTGAFLLAASRLVRLWNHLR